MSNTTTLNTPFGVLNIGTVPSSGATVTVAEMKQSFKKIAQNEIIPTEEEIENAKNQKQQKTDQL